MLEFFFFYIDNILIHFLFDSAVDDFRLVYGYLFIMLNSFSKANGFKGTFVFFIDTDDKNYYRWLYLNMWVCGKLKMIFYY